MSTPTYYGDVLVRAFDDATNSLKTKVDATISGTQEVVISQADDSIQACGYRSTLTDRSGTASGSSAQVAAANSARKYFIIQNLDSSINIFVNFGATATTGAGSFLIEPKGSMVFEGGFMTTQAINVIAASGTPAYTAKEAT